jgi:hypothetical protein
MIELLMVMMSAVVRLPLMTFDFEYLLLAVFVLIRLQVSLQVFQLPNN